MPPCKLQAHIPITDTLQVPNNHKCSLGTHSSSKSSKEIKELAHTFAEVDESQDLQSASWRPRRAHSVSPGQVWKPENPESWEDSSTQKPGASRPRKSQCSSLSLQARKILCPSSKHSGSRSPFLLVEGSAFLLYSGLRLIGWGPPGLRRAVCFTQCTNSNSWIQKHSPRHTQSHVWPNGSEALMAQSSWHLKLTITPLYCLSEASLLRWGFLSENMPLL